MPEQDNTRLNLPFFPGWSSKEKEDYWRVPEHIMERNRCAHVFPPVPWHLRPKPYAWTIREDDWNV